MNAFSLTDAMEKSRTGSLTYSEVTEVAAELNRAVESGSRKLYKLVLILGRAGDSRYEPVLAKLLHYPRDPMVSALCLDVLCKKWELCESYTSDIESFVQGVEWDFEDDVKLIAMSAAGECLRSHSHSSLVALLRHEFDNPLSSSAVEAGAYSALGRAAGLEWSELPSATRGIDRDHDIDQRVVDWWERA